MRTAAARPRPNIFAEHGLAQHEGEEDGDHDRGAGGDDPGGLGQPVGDGERVVAGPVVLLLDPRQQEHLVVHGEAEQDREDPDRQLDRDRRRLRDADQVSERSAADREREDTERGRTGRQQVHDHGLERDHDRAEHHHQQQERDQQHAAEEERQPVSGPPGGVEVRGHHATDVRR